MVRRVADVPEVRLSLEESTLNRIWNADRKRGQTFWSNMGDQFNIMHEALEQARIEERGKLHEQLRTMAERIADLEDMVVKKNEKIKELEEQHIEDIEELRKLQSFP